MHDGPNSKPNRPEWLLLVALIALSFAVRLPRISEMESAHTWLTSHTALINRVWQMTSLPANHFSLVSNWPNPADRHAEYYRGAVVDKDGNSYFISFPPLAFYLSYLYFSGTGQVASILQLRLLMWIAAAAGAIWLWKINPPGRAMAAGVFLLSPISLYYFGTSYFPLILSIPIWLAFTAESVRDTPRAAHIGAWAFVLSYTDWLGVLATIAVSVLWARERSWKLIAAAFAGTAAAVILTLVTYSSIAGWQALANALQNRLEYRSGAGVRWQAETYLVIARHYLIGFWPVLIILAGAARLPKRSRLLFLLFVPVALDHLLLLNHTAIHRYSVLKAAPFLAVLAGSAWERRRWKNLGWSSAVAVMALVCSVYWFLRTPLRTPPEVEAVAKVVQYQTGLDTVLFLESNAQGLRVAEPELLLLAERNFHVVPDLEHAKSRLKELGLDRGMYIRLVSLRPPKATAVRVERE